MILNYQLAGGGGGGGGGRGCSRAGTITRSGFMIKYCGGEGVGRAAV